MTGNSKRENREIPQASSLLVEQPGAAGKRHRRHSRHVREWEVGRVHSTCEAGEQSGLWSVAELVEGRDPTKGNVSCPSQTGHRAGLFVIRGPLCVRDAAMQSRLT